MSYNARKYTKLLLTDLEASTDGIRKQMKRVQK